MGAVGCRRLSKAAIAVPTRVTPFVRFSENLCSISITNVIEGADHESDHHFEEKKLQGFLIYLFVFMPA